ncbi:hypothetical protein M405DRAFT_557903 [Rhizopogon salebrosus TDB-379]|nr:hypothetical protein M405DRAFT_557903 [Rhizopogon salebrosus TDB-379]
MSSTPSHILLEDVAHSPSPHIYMIMSQSDIPTHGRALLGHVSSLSRVRRTYESLRNTLPRLETLSLSQWFATQPASCLVWTCYRAESTNVMHLETSGRPVS